MVVTTKGIFNNDVLIDGADMDIPESAVLYINNRVRKFMEQADIDEEDLFKLLSHEGNKATYDRYFVLYFPRKRIEVTAFIDLNHKNDDTDYFISIHQINFSISLEEVMENACPILGL